MLLWNLKEILEFRKEKKNVIIFADYSWFIGSVDGKPHVKRKRILCIIVIFHKRTHGVMQFFMCCLHHFFDKHKCHMEDQVFWHSYHNTFLMMDADFETSFLVLIIKMICDSPV
ncbi:hypothetical protein ACJX0J_028879, partial [Zea mays]